MIRLTALGLLGFALAACSSDATPESGGAGAPASAGAPSAGAPSAGAPSAGAPSSAGSGGALETAGGGSAGSSVAGMAGSAAGSAPEVSSEGDGNFEVGPNGYTKDPNLTDLGKPKGKRFNFTMHSKDSAIFKGTDSTLTKPVKKAEWDRGISVYVPAQYVDGTEAPILVIQEGQIDNVSRALDNLTISTDPLKKLPAFVAIAVSNGSDRDGSDGQGSERGLEYDTLSDRYSRFINTEVLPAVLANAELKAAFPKFKITSDPEGRGTMGCSSGGAAALTMGWFATESFHRIITYSGTFVDQQNHTQPEAKTYPFGAWEYHSEMKLIENTPKKPLRIFLHCSENDNGSTNPESGHHNWVMANQRTAAALKDQGYHYRFMYTKGLGHCDGKAFDLTLADTLSWVWRGYQSPTR